MNIMKFNTFTLQVFTFFIKTPQSKEPVFLSSKMVSTLNRISDSLQGLDKSDILFSL